MNALTEFRNAECKPADKIDTFHVGDTVRVHFRIVEGEKERIQVYEGVVISRKGGNGPNAKFTVRRVAFNEGVERVFPLHSPRVERVEVVQEGKVRRSKLYYLRDRSGKAARVKRRERSAKQLEEAAAARKVARAEKRAKKSAKGKKGEAKAEAKAETKVEAPAEAPAEESAE